VDLYGYGSTVNAENAGLGDLVFSFVLFFRHVAYYVICAYMMYTMYQ